MAMEYSIAQKLNDNTSKEPITFTIPSEEGNYKLTLTLTDGTQIPVNGNITVNSTVNTYNLKLTMSDGRVVDLGNFETEEIGEIIMKYIYGNWKMNSDVSTATTFATQFNSIFTNPPNVEVMIAPQASLIMLLKEKIASGVKIGAQSCYFENSGAYTGQNSCTAVKSCGATYAIVNHSEQIEYFGYTLDRGNKETINIIANDMIPIICCGEKLEQRERGQQFCWVEYQIRSLLQNITANQIQDAVRIVYEPIWAIGTGKVCAPTQAQEMCAHIKAVVTSMYDEPTGDSVKILYGGSMNASNAAALLAQPDIHGGLLSGASLKPIDFNNIINIAASR